VYSATLIIEDPSSAVQILLIIDQYSRVFSAHPIRILREDMPTHRDIIIAASKKYGIKKIPSLITRDEHLLVGISAICAFIPKLAQAINFVEREPQFRESRGPLGSRDPQGPAVPGLGSNDPFAEYQLSHYHDTSEEDQDEEEPDAKIEVRYERYRSEMKKRKAQILVPPEGAPGAPIDPEGLAGAPPGGPKRSTRVTSDAQGGAVDVDDQHAQRTAHVSAPRAAPRAAPRLMSQPPAAPKRSATVASGEDGEFMTKFMEMNEETPSV